MKARPELQAAGWALALATLACRAAGTAPAELGFPLVLEFEGEESVGEELLGRVVRAELVRLQVAAPDKAAIDDAAFALELYYRARGHADVHVEYEYAPSAEGAPRARFSIDEGPLVRVRTLVLEGPAAVQPAEVRALLEPIVEGGVFDEDRLTGRLDAVHEAYRERGHLRIEIDAPEVVFDEARTSVTLRIALREGPVFRVRAVDVQGGVEALAPRESAIASRYIDKPFLPGVQAELEHALSADYQRRGYPDAGVRLRPELDETSGDVRIRAQVTPGERVTIAHFRIEGNARTKDAAILGVLDIERGSLYDSERRRQAFRDLYATGLFESVALELEGSGPERTLVVTVAEARAVEIRAEPGWGSYEGPRILLGIEEKNFLGRGQVLALEGSASLRAQGARLAWIDRDFLGTRFTSETTFFVEQREEPTFEFVRRGFSFFLRRPLGRDWSSSVGYEFRPTNITDDSLSTPLATDVDADSQVASLSGVLVFDDRDNLLLPTRGRQALARLELADDGLGSDTEFVRARLEYTHLFRLGERTVLAGSARTGVIAPFGTTDEIPLPERFFNGGENSVRSFKEDELPPVGPGGGDVESGGEAATTLNLELRRALTGNLTGAVFLDAGNVAFQAQDYARFSGFRTGLGAGLRYMLPIGPVRLDLGWNPDPDQDEDEYVLHFSVGFPF